MKEQGFITKDEYDEAMADNVYDRISETASNTTTSKPYTYFIDAVINQVVDDLVTEKSYTETQAYIICSIAAALRSTLHRMLIFRPSVMTRVLMRDYLNGDTEYGLDYLHYPQGRWILLRTTAKNNFASYIQTEMGHDTPLLYGF